MGLFFISEGRKIHIILETYFFNTLFSFKKEIISLKALFSVIESRQSFARTENGISHSVGGAFNLSGIL